MKSSTGTGEIVIAAVTTQTIRVCILGTTPLIMNSMSEKAYQELLMPKGRKTAADKAVSLKHDPVSEFRNSMLRTKGADSPTVLGVSAAWFKRAMMTAALDTPGAKKTQIGRLLWVQGTDKLPVWGVPKVFMAIVRSADMNRTPDVRTRAILPEWACSIDIAFPSPTLRQQSIVNLLSSSGLFSGVGDWRQEKGSNNYGSFRLCSADDPDYLRIMETMGRDVQQEAIDNPEPYDDETAQLLKWFDVESNRRGMKVAA